jgi:hypothetical protein
MLYRVSQEERSIFWDIIVSVILSKNCVYTCVLFWTVSEVELFHCTIPTFLVRKKYCIMFLIPLFIVQVTKLVQFTYYNAFLKIPPSISVCFKTCMRTWRVACLYSVQRAIWSNSSISESVQNRICTYMYFLLRILTSPSVTFCIILGCWQHH